MNTWLRHGGCAVLEESNYIDPLGNDLAVDDKVDLGVNLMVGLTAILVTLSKLGCASTQSIDSDLSIPGVSRQVKDVTISKGLIACLVVHWTLRPLLLMIKCKGQVCDLHLPGDLWKDSCLIVPGGGCGPLWVERDHQLELTGLRVGEDLNLCSSGKVTYQSRVCLGYHQFEGIQDLML